MKKVKKKSSWPTGTICKEEEIGRKSSDKWHPMIHSSLIGNFQILSIS